MMLSETIGTTIAAIFTLMVYSYFVKREDNPAFRFAQSTILGMAMAYAVVLVLAKTIDTFVFAKVANGNLIPLIPLIFGIIMYARFIPKYEYLSRIPVAIIVAVGVGIGARAALESQIIHQLLATSKFVIFGVSMFTAFDNLIFLIAMFSTLVYFFFTLKPEITEKLKPISKLGRYFMMIYFGARYGQTIMFRLVLFLGRLTFLLFDWLKLG